jgi:Zn-dependent peptidase ImmA (M78 family)/transcriptional regulator with XRE-family HTH domain
VKTGTPGFIGARLREARLARGLTAIALADQLGVHRSAVSHYERGEQTPRPEVMRQIEAVLDLPAQYFWRVPAPERKRILFWRSISAATKSARVTAQSRYVWLEEIVRYLREYVNFPEVNFPDFATPKRPAHISAEMIEELALHTRRFWKLGNGAISNVVWLLENNGAIITRTKLEANTLDAFSEWHPSENVPYFILGADKNVAARSRFDIAHELGHVVLHRHIEAACVGRDTDHSLMERQANRFAGAFLLPEEAFASDFFSASLDTFQALKPKWGVSIQLMVHRAHDLDLISDEQAKRLWINCTRRGWRITEPLDDRLPVEEPRLLRRALEMLITERVQTRAQILSALPYSIGDIEELAGLREGFLTEKPVTVSLKDFAAKARVNDVQQESNGTQGEVLAFRSKDSESEQSQPLWRRR